MKLFLLFLTLFLISLPGDSSPIVTKKKIEYGMLQEPNSSIIDFMTGQYKDVIREKAFPWYGTKNSSDPGKFDFGDVHKYILSLLSKFNNETKMYDKGVIRSTYFILVTPFNKTESVVPLSSAFDIEQKHANVNKGNAHLKDDIEEFEVNRKHPETFESSEKYPVIILSNEKYPETFRSNEKYPETFRSKEKRPEIFEDIKKYPEAYEAFKKYLRMIQSSEKYPNIFESNREDSRTPQSKENLTLTSQSHRNNPETFESNRENFETFQSNGKQSENDYNFQPSTEKLENMTGVVHNISIRAAELPGYSAQKPRNNSTKQNPHLDVIRAEADTPIEINSPNSTNHKTVEIATEPIQEQKLNVTNTKQNLQDESATTGKSVGYNNETIGHLKKIPAGIGHRHHNQAKTEAQTFTENAKGDSDEFKSVSNDANLRSEVNQSQEATENGIGTYGTNINETILDYAKDHSLNKGKNNTADNSKENASTEIKRSQYETIIKHIKETDEDITARTKDFIKEIFGNKQRHLLNKEEDDEGVTNLGIKQSNQMMADHEQTVNDSSIDKTGIANQTILSNTDDQPFTGGKIDSAYNSEETPHVKTKPEHQVMTVQIETLNETESSNAGEHLPSEENAEVNNSRQLGNPGVKHRQHAEMAVEQMQTTNESSTDKIEISKQTESDNGKEVDISASNNSKEMEIENTEQNTKNEETETNVKNTTVEAETARKAVVGKKDDHSLPKEHFDLGKTMESTPIPNISYEKSAIGLGEKIDKKPEEIGLSDKILMI